MVVRRPTILVAWVQRLHFFRRLAPRPVPVFRHLIKVLHATLAVNRYCEISTFLFALLIESIHLHLLL